MKIKAFFVLVAVFVILALCSCVSKSSNGKMPVLKNSRDSIDWPGVYKGKVPLEKGLGLDVCLKLYRDQSFDLKIEYLDKSQKTIDWKGSFKWDITGNVIVIDIIDSPRYFKVTENMLIELDNEGKPLSEKLTDYYVLIKER